MPPDARLLRQPREAASFNHALQRNQAGPCSHLPSVIIAVVYVILTCRSIGGESLDWLKRLEAIVVGKKTTEIEKLLGLPDEVIDDQWFYDRKFAPTEVARCVAFQLEIKDGQAKRIFEIESNTEFFQIGTFPGYIGRNALQKTIVASFINLKTVQELSEIERKQFLADAKFRIRMAEKRAQKLIVPMKCPYAVVLLGILGVKQEVRTKDEVDLGRFKQEIDAALSEAR